VERVITSSQSTLIRAQGKQVINFCANNYLGFCNHPRVVKAAQDIMNDYGYGMSSVRFICGTQDIHKQLEAQIAKFFKMEDCILAPSGFDANAGFFEAVLSQEDAIISDELNHASIIDGIRLCKAERHRYKHLDMNQLEKMLQETQHCRMRVIVTDGVFSMDGDMAPLDVIVGLAKKYNAFTFVDEAHATGALGKTGRGTPEIFGLEGQIDVINSTLGKALGGGTGGFTVAKREVVDVLRQKCRPYLFSNSIAPSTVAASMEAIKMLDDSPQILEQLRKNTTQFRQGMKAAGFTILGNDNIAICPVMIGDARKAA
jgi:glycine C-acetyltransferase